MSVVFNALSVEGSILEEKADTVILPGLLGDIGIKNSEREFCYILKEGIVYLINEKGKVFKRLYIFGGHVLAINDQVKLSLNQGLYFDLDTITVKDIDLKIKEFTELQKNSSELQEDFYKNQIEHHNLLKASLNINNYA